MIPMKWCPRRRTHLGWFVPVIMVPECQAPGRTGRTVHGDSDAKLGGEWSGVLALGGFRDFGTEASRKTPDDYYSHGFRTRPRRLKSVRSVAKTLRVLAGMASTTMEFATRIQRIRPTNRESADWPAMRRTSLDSAKQVPAPRLDSLQILVAEL